MSYNYENFDAKSYDLANFRGPKPGTRAPDFEVSKSDGGTKQLLGFETQFLVLEMGSLTCPLFQGRRPAMERLRQSQPDVTCVVLYVREAHPGASIGAHRSMDDKQSCAKRLAEAEGEARQILIDNIEGQVHNAYGGYPNSVFIINRNGCVVYASDWNDPKATKRALTKLIAGQPANDVRAFFKPVHPRVSLRVLGNGGKGSMSDFLRSFPRLIWNNLMLRNLRLLTGHAPVVAPDTRC